MNDFHCARCGSCCRQPGYVYLEKGEAERLAQALGLGLYDFTERYCEVLEKRHLVLRKHEDERCVFLNSKGCQVYQERPKQCRDFPKIWNTVRSREYCAGLKKD